MPEMEVSELIARQPGEEEKRCIRRIVRHKEVAQIIAAILAVILAAMWATLHQVNF